MANLSLTPTISDVMNLQLSIDNLSNERKELKALIAETHPEISVKQSETENAILVKVTVNGITLTKSIANTDFVSTFSEDELTQMVADEAKELYYRMLKEKILPKIAIVRHRLKQKLAKGSL